MKRLIYDALSIEEGEGLGVFLLIVQSFFIGIFFQSFEISATALFMESHGKDMIGNAYLLSGLIGIVLTAIYSQLQRVIRFSSLSFLNLLFITVTTATLWYGLQVNNDPRLIFAAFLLMGPLYILSFVGFSGMVGRMYTLRQGKRLFSIVDSGMIFGIIVISISIPFILKLIPETKDLILISAASVFLSMLVQLIISLKFELNAKVQATVEKKSDKKAGIGVFFKNKYIRLTSLFVMLTMIAAFFITYSFLAVTKINYPSTKEFAGFLGKFIFAVMIFSFIIKTFVYSRLMKTYGLKVNLMIMPVLLVAFTVVTALSGTFFGYSQEGTAAFLVFFLLTALLRFFIISLKDSIQTPSIKLLFQPLDAEIRYDIQAKVEGVINELSAVLAGGVLAILALLNFIENIHYTYILIGIIAAWVYVTVRLYKQYQNTLRLSLTNFMSEVSNSGEKANNVIDSLASDSDTEKLIYSLKLIKQIKPAEYEIELVNLVKSSNVKLRIYALRTINENTLLNAHEPVKELIKKETDPDAKKLAIEVDNNLGSLLKMNEVTSEITALARSKNKSDRERAARIIGATPKTEYLPLLKSLLKDIEPNVKIAAFHAVKEDDYRELRPTLVEYLESPYYYSAARSALVELGDKSLDLLEKSFYKSGITTNTMVLITNTISQIGSEKAIEFLLDKLSFPDRNVVLEAVNGLNHLDYQADEKNLIKIIRAIELNIGISAWNLSIKLDLKRTGYNNTLTLAMNEELNKSQNLLFTLLSIAYDKSSIHHIRENIESGTTEAISFAIEMLDLFIAEQLKSTLFPLLEDNKLEDKVRELELHFPIKRHDRMEVLYQVINRSSNYVSHYTQACAIYSILENEINDVDNNLISSLFNPDPLLRETAAAVIYNIDPQTYDRCAIRLHEEIKVQLDKTLSQLQNNRSHLLIEKVYSLKKSQLINSLNNNTITELALLARERSEPENTVLLDNNLNNDQPILFLLNGEVALEINNKLIANFTENDLIGDMLIDESVGNHKLFTTTACEFYEMPKKGVYDIMFKNPELIAVLAGVIDKKFDKENAVAN